MIVIVTYSNYPNGSASAIRYRTFAQTYVDMGYKVHVLDKSRGGDKQSTNVSRIAKYKRFLLFGRHIINALHRLRKHNNINAVIIGSDVNVYHAMIIQRWCRRNNLKCVFDTTEWYSKEQVSNWLISTAYWEKDILNRFVINKHSRVIAISSYLYDYFEKKGCKITQIPIIYNPNIKEEATTDIADKKTLGGKLHIVYAGSHLKMDNIPLILESIALMPNSERDKAQFTIFGLSKEKICPCISHETMTKVQDSLCIMGRRPNSEVLDAYSHADFSIVLRDPNLRVNKAGFPSKVVESMRLGTPVICNYSSDLKKYLVHGENSIIVNELSAKVISEQLQALIHMSQAKKRLISRNAQQTIQDKLNSKLFEEEFKMIIS